MGLSKDQLPIITFINITYFEMQQLVTKFAKIFLQVAKIKR